MIAPWLQITMFVILSNVAHVALMLVGQDIENNEFTFLALAVSFWFCVFILVAPSSHATTGHKLLVLTCAVGALYCLVSTVAAAWADEYLIAWSLYSFMYDNFYTVMQVLTAMEVISIFINNAVRLGRIGGAIDGFINHVYSTVFDRAYALLSRKRF